MRRIPELDALRGIAAVVIVVYHLWFPTYGALGAAVDLFFVISGYLITTIILKQSEQPGFLVNFYLRRSLRIWPIYYLSLLLFLAFNSVLPRQYPTEALPYFLTYTQNIQEYWGGSSPPFVHGFHHTWSLAIEEQYYLFWPIALVLFGRRAVFPLALTLMALSMGTRMAGFSRWILITRLDGLALGGILAAMIFANERGQLSMTRIRRTLLVAGFTSLTFMVRGNALLTGLTATWPALGDPHVVISLRMFAMNLLFFALIGWIVIDSGNRRWSWLREGRLAELGQMSYGIYLYHYILLDLVQDFADRYGISNRFLIDGLKVSLSFAVAAASWRCVERPLLGLKDRFGYRERSHPGKILVPELTRIESFQPGVR